MSTASAGSCSRPCARSAPRASSRSGAAACTAEANTRAQPHDIAWETLSAALRNRHPAPVPGEFIRVNRIFPYDTHREMLKVHLYFVKVFGCHIAGNNIPIDLSG